MSEYKVCLTTVVNVQPHDNADSLDFITVYGFQVIARKGSFAVGDKTFLIPIDSVLPADLDAQIFPEGSKVKLYHRRVKQIKLRGRASQGLLISEEDVHKLMESRGLKSRLYFDLEEDYSKLLGITKYEPPVPEFQQSQEPTKTKRKPLENSQFHQYNGLDNIKWFPSMFDDEEVVIQEKLHGTNARAGILPTEANTTWKKIKKFFGFLPKYEKVYGSNKVELTNRQGYTGFYGEDIYGKAFQTVNVFSKIRNNEIVYGEIVAEGIQKNYNYGHRSPHFVLFDVKILKDDGTFYWLPPEEVELFAKERGFDMVPVLYKGAYNEQLSKELTIGNSVYCPSQKVREGVVIKSRLRYNNDRGNKRALKLISEAYLEKDQTDFH